MPHHQGTGGGFAGHQVQQHPAGSPAQGHRIEVDRRNGGVEAGGQLAVVEAGQTYVVRHPDAPGLQLQRHIESQPVVPAEDAVGASFQHCVQRVDPLGVALDAGADEGRVGLDAQLGQGVKVPFGTVLVDVVAGAAGEQSDPPQAKLKQQPGHFLTGGGLVVVYLGDGGVLGPSDGDKGHLVAAQKFDTGIVLDGAGEDHPVHFVAVELALQLAGVGPGDIAEQQVVPPLGCRRADASHALAQKGQVQVDEVAGDDHGQVVGLAGRGLGAHRRFSPGLGDVVSHPAAGSLADAALAREGTGNGGLGHPQGFCDLVDGDLLGRLVFCRHDVPSLVCAIGCAFLQHTSQDGALSRDCAQFPLTVPVPCHRLCRRRCRSRAARRRPAAERGWYCSSAKRAVPHGGRPAHPRAGRPAGS